MGVRLTSKLDNSTRDFADAMTITVIEQAPPVYFFAPNLDALGTTAKQYSTAATLLVLLNIPLTRNLGERTK